MEGIIGLVIIGWCVWFIIRHPLKTLSLLLKLGFLSILGFGVFLALYWFSLTP
tara:strand:- start:207 stop:365 length:159 start_codon:yes stop_codon:yes gene_type:complete